MNLSTPQPESFGTGPQTTSFLPRITSRQLRSFLDHGATLVITIGGLATILSILGIFAYLFIEVAPLFYSVSGNQIASVKVDSLKVPISQSQNVGVGIDEYMEIVYVIQAGEVLFYQIPSGKFLALASRPTWEPGQITAMGRSSGKRQVWGLGTRDGQIIPLSVNFEVTFKDNKRTIFPVISASDPITLTSQPEPISLLAYQETEDGLATAGLTASGHLFFAKSQKAESGLFDMDEEQEMVQAEIVDDRVSTITTLLLDSMGESLLAGTGNGDLLYWDVRDVEEPRLMGTYQVGQPITALAYLIGDRSVVVGTSEGVVEIWMPNIDPDKGGDPQLFNIREFSQHGSRVLAISSSQRDKGFITTDASGRFSVHYSTSAQTLLDIPGKGIPARGIMFSPKGDGAVMVNEQGELAAYHIDNEHPETTFRALFGAVLYEGYRQALHIWQSTGGSDAFEPKFGLWPLMFGTLKGTFYAMLLATPLAVLGAIYTAMFMTASLRAIVKPTVEIMAALPTVVLGFLAALWFAPLLEKIFPAVSVMFFAVPISIVVGVVCWQFFPRSVQKSGHLMELVAFFFLICASVWICLQFNKEIEAWIYDSNYKEWLSSTFGVGYDQRNALVIAFAMGIAVIPTIFSISEDSISNVPRHLIAGSLALGATSWQTLVKLVIVSASPGIFSALMIGFGRAVGETMIVLMATGNTPVMEMNLFNGFRTLSANIAVEMPEAPHGGTLYRLLFMAGLLLFIFTSIVNTLAEIVRQRLRVRYGQF